MNRAWGAMLAGCSVVLAAASAGGAIVRVEVTGTVENNHFTGGTLVGVRPGERVLLTFDIDSNVFVNNPVYPTRGYPIDVASFHLQIGAVSVPLRSPQPNGATSYFVIRNNDPAVDGFLFSNSTTLPVAPAVDVGLPNLGINFLRTFTVGTMWPSLDILDALGSWGYEYMSVYDFRVGNPMSLYYERISVSVFPPYCPGDLNGDNIVDLSDLTRLLSNFGDSIFATMRDGDIDGDHDVDLSDLTLLLSNFGAGCS